MGFFGGRIAEFAGTSVALLAGRPLTRLRTVNLKHYYISVEMQSRLRGARPGVDVGLSLARSDSQGPRCIAVAE